jgi:FMN phosphatase YigB (HAD superfamily)
MKIALFDVGDTLIYRKKDDEIIELNFLDQYLNSNFKNFDELVSKKYRKFQKSLFTKSASDIYSLQKEKECYFEFINEVVQSLDLSCFSPSDIREIVKLRFSISNYYLFVGIYPMLQTLFNSGVQIGVVTNGKPSRREVLRILGIDRFINKNLVFISDEMKFKKPEFKFFEVVNLKINDYLKTDKQIFLIDDDLENCRMANNFSDWTSIHFHTGVNSINEVLSVILKT